MDTRAGGYYHSTKLDDAVVTWQDESKCLEVAVGFFHYSVIKQHYPSTQRFQDSNLLHQKKPPKCFQNIQRNLKQENNKDPGISRNKE